MHFGALKRIMGGSNGPDTEKQNNRSNTRLEIPMKSEYSHGEVSKFRETQAYGILIEWLFEYPISIRIGARQLSHGQDSQ